MGAAHADQDARFMDGNGSVTLCARTASCLVHWASTPALLPDVPTTQKKSSAGITPAAAGRCGWLWPGAAAGSSAGTAHR